MSQLTMFDAFDQQRLSRPCDPNVIDSDVPRLTGQNAAILARLREGPATNRELAGYSLKYTSRLSDLRARGHEVTCVRGDGGLNTYTLTWDNGG